MKSYEYLTCLCMSLIDCLTFKKPICTEIRSIWVNSSSTILMYLSILFCRCSFYRSRLLLKHFSMKLNSFIQRLKMFRFISYRMQDFDQQLTVNSYGDLSKKSWIPNFDPRSRVAIAKDVSFEFRSFATRVVSMYFESWSLPCVIYIFIFW